MHTSQTRLARFTAWKRTLSLRWERRTEIGSLSRARCANEAIVMVERMHGGIPQGLSNTSRAQPRQQEFSDLELMRLTLNQMDYAMVVLDVDSCAIHYANALGRDALQGAADGPGNSPYDTGLCVVHRRVTARRPADAEQLQHALTRTRTGVRGLLSLGTGAHRCTIAVVPLSSGKNAAPVGPHAYANPADTRACHALLMFAKQQLCDDSTMALFARERGLTSAEAQVLAQICRGLRPSQIADYHGVQISTVRTQLRNIRIKTGSETKGEVVQKVSVLPPMARRLSAHMIDSGWQQ